MSDCVSVTFSPSQKRQIDYFAFSEKISYAEAVRRLVKIALATEGINCTWRRTRK